MSFQESLQFDAQVAEQRRREAPEIHRDRLVAGQCVVALARAVTGLFDLEQLDDLREHTGGVHLADTAGDGAVFAQRLAQREADH